MQRHIRVIAPAVKWCAVAAGAGLIEKYRCDRQLLGIRNVAVQARVITEVPGDEGSTEVAADELRVLQQTGEQALITLYTQ
ncbi:hypothetical protein D1872_327370 [compost metagenome]